MGGCFSVLISPPSALLKKEFPKQSQSTITGINSSLPHLPPPPGVCKISSAVVSRAPACRVSTFIDISNTGRYHSLQDVTIKKYPLDHFTGEATLYSSIQYYLSERITRRKTRKEEIYQKVTSDKKTKSMNVYLQPYPYK